MKENKYIKAMSNIDIPPEMRHRVISRLTSANRKEKNYILKFKENSIMMTKKKLATAAATVVMVLGITAAAASGMITSWFSSSSSAPDYRSLPSAEQVVKDIGYVPVLVESFSNGYTFSSGSIVSNDLQDDSNNSVETFKSLTFHYAKGDDKILFSQLKYDSEPEISGDPIASENGTNIYLNSYTHKVVPADYELTEADKEAERNGNLVFSYGSNEVSVSEVKNITWNVGDMHFVLTQIDGNLSENDLVQMAKEIIAQYK